MSGTERYIRFEPVPRPGRKTEIYRVMSVHYDVELGTIEWHSPWRQYVFFPADLTYWSAGCLRDVEEQISRLMAERRERR